MVNSDRPRHSHGKGLVVGLLLLMGVELYLHNDDFLHRYRSVFAAGRAADKIDFVAEAQPALVFIGNSRVDNGIAPTTVATTLGAQPSEVFNLGVPGMNTRVLHGIVRQLADRSALHPSGVRCVFIGLDASLFVEEDAMNYGVFFADREKMLEHGEYHPLLASVFRLWGFSGNLKGLREPGRLRDFLAATLVDRDPWGGSAADSRGFRAKKETLNADDVKIESAAMDIPPVDSPLVRYLLDTMDELKQRHVVIGVFFPPQFRRTNVFERAREPPSNAGRLLSLLRERDVNIYSLNESIDFDAKWFANPGHLNEGGARLYSSLLTARISKDCRKEGGSQ